MYKYRNVCLCEYMGICDLSVCMSECMHMPFECLCDFMCACVFFEYICEYMCVCDVSGQCPCLLNHGSLCTVLLSVLTKTQCCWEPESKVRATSASCNSSLRAAEI